MTPGASPPDNDPAHKEQLLGLFSTLADAYLPLLPDVRDPKFCTIPLWACAEAALWDGGSSSGSSEAGAQLVRRLGTAVLERLAEADGELLRRATGQGHSLLWWSLSEIPLELLPAQTTEHLMDVSSSKLLLMGHWVLGPQTCSNIMLAVARRQWGSPELVHHLTACLVAVRRQAEYQGLANTVYALGKLAEECGHTPRQEDLQCLADEIAVRSQAQLADAAAADMDGQAAASGFSPQGISIMLWGFSKLGYTDSVVLEPLAAVAALVAGRSTEQHLTRSLSALADMNCTTEAYAPAVAALAEAALDLLRSRRETCTVQGLVNLLRAVALLQPPSSPALARAAADECLRRDLSTFMPQQLSIAAWALAKLAEPLELEHAPWFQNWFAAAVDAAQKPGFSTADSQNVSNLIYALGLAQHRPPPSWLGSMASTKQLLSAIPQDCANALYAVADLYGSTDILDADICAAVLSLTDVLAERLRALLQQQAEDLTDQGLSNPLWAMAVLGPAALSRYHGLVEGLLREVARRWVSGQRAQFCVPEASQLLHVQLELEQQERQAAGPDGAGGTQLSGILAAAVGHSGQPMLAAFRASLEAEAVADDPETTRLKLGMRAALSRLQRQAAPSSPQRIVSVQEERWVPELCRRVHFLLELSDGRRVAVMADGPYRFLANEPHTRTRTGRTKLRDRQLKRVLGAGQVVHVRHWRWWGLEGRQRAEEELLRDLLWPPGADAGPAAVGSGAAGGADAAAASAGAAAAPASAPEPATPADPGTDDARSRARQRMAMLSSRTVRRR